MSALQGLVAVAVAEMRSARRLVRTWLFIVLGVLLSVLAYVYYSAIHGLASGLSASIGVVNPRFILSSMGTIALWVMVVAIVFLAFDVRARDARERIADVLDSRPLGNLTLLAGRLAGISFVAWATLLIALLIVQGLGAIALAAEWPVGDTIEPYSLSVFLFVDAPPTLVLWCSLVILLTVLVRHRLVVALVALALIGAQGWWVINHMPIYLTSVLAGISASSVGSDVLPRFAQGVDFAQRACQLLLAGGFLVLAAALHPRQDHHAKPQRLGIGAAVVAVAVLGIAALVWNARSNVARVDDWLAAHQDARERPRPELQDVQGRVVIEPGRLVTADLDYRLAVEGIEGEMLFSLNPGMVVTALRLDGEEAAFEHRLGLLRVTLPSARSDVALSISIAGVPDPAFAYLDSAIDMNRASGGAILQLLGTEASVFEDAYVALMPGVFWMPLPGAAVGRDDPSGQGRDFFAVDLEVETPQSWLVAGPGLRRGENGRFRFNPAAVVPEVVLLASRFERYATRIADVELELLASPVHMRNIEIFADAADELRERVAQLLDAAAGMALAYPYAGLSVVETPAQLRTFGGGWRMDTVQALPGVLLLREGGFPTARFEFQFRDADELERAGALAEFKVNRLRGFFQNDVTGGNPLHGGARNFLAFQTGAEGRGAVALDFIVHELTAQLLTGARSGFFSPYMLASQEAFGQTVTQSMMSFFQGSATSIGGSVYMANTRRPAVWGSALGAALVDLKPDDAPKLALDVLWLKGPEIAQAILHGLGRETTAAFLAELRRRHAGGNYDAAELASAAKAVGADVDAVLGDWLGSAALPGFVVSPVEVERLTDDEQGQPRYQIRVHVRNEELVPGLVRLTYGEWQGGENTEGGWVADATQPTRVAGGSAVELGLVAAKPPEQVKVEPYLALNRRPMDMPLPEVDETEALATAPFSGSRPSDWRPRPQAGIVVDDLDAGFAVRFDEAEGGLRLTGGAVAADTSGLEMDEGLPVFGLTPIPGWQRQEAAEGWGKYRRTLARAPSGDGAAKAIFTAQLPAAGRWRLEYHLPRINAFRGFVGFGDEGAQARAERFVDTSQGTYDLRIRTADGQETPLSFDAAAAEYGWNRLGEHELPSGGVDVVVSDDTSGSYVIADAIRWLRVDEA